jgi:flagellar hook-basal body complex protein FliE
MNDIRAIGPLQDGLSPEKIKKTQTTPANVPSFKETLSTFMTDVNDMQIKADESMKRLMAGEITDVHQVMSAAEEANVAFNMMMEIRNKVMDAYQEVMRIRL